MTVTILLQIYNDHRYIKNGDPTSMFPLTVGNCHRYKCDNTVSHVVTFCLILIFQDIKNIKEHKLCLHTSSNMTNDCYCMNAPCYHGYFFFLRHTNSQSWICSYFGMSHVQTWRGGGSLWPIVQPATRGLSRYFGFTLVELSCWSSLFTLYTKQL